MEDALAVTTVYSSRARPVQPMLHSPCELADGQLLPRAASENWHLQTSVQTSVQSEKGDIAVLISRGDLESIPTVDRPNKQSINQIDRQTSEPAKQVV